ncbi:MAG: bifunctional folylpolyglutamate synthase/dihydrofolate synthase [Coriobacteriaceae bacterium]|nr:bifunctional folylpolyglutamate synthase/dihydrofolate synthase [Coriobacteriaceae bacterium]
MTMDSDQAIKYINQREWRESRLGLERVSELLELMGNPQLETRFAHIAGTNGKGSVCIMLAESLMAAGYRTGLFISPYINVFNERIQVDGQAITDDALAKITERVRLYADQMSDHPTEFELIAAVAMQYFADQHCDIVVLEVGLGGRLDATNVIPVPEVAVIAPISLDHTAELGDTLEKIASEKAGIIKSGGCLVSAVQSPGVSEVINEICGNRGASLRAVDPAALVVQANNLTGQRFTYKHHQDLEIRLLGTYQPANAAVVIEVVECLRRKDWLISDDALRKGLLSARWPARFELVHQRPWFIIDGGHNPQGAVSLAANIRHYFADKPVDLIFGVMADKDIQTMLSAVLPLASRVFTVTADNHRAMPADQLAEYVRASGLTEVLACDSVEQAVTQAMQTADPDQVICAFGSFYIAGAIRRLFGLVPQTG